MNKQKQFIKYIGAFCGQYRKRVLKLTLKEMSKKHSVPVSTISSFEMGRSSSLNMFYLYIISSTSNIQINIFNENIRQIIKETYEG